MTWFCHKIALDLGPQPQRLYSKVLGLYQVGHPLHISGAMTHMQIESGVILMQEGCEVMRGPKCWARSSWAPPGMQPRGWAKP